MPQLERIDPDWLRNPNEVMLSFFAIDHTEAWMYE
jgi:hypothetical protein